MNLHAIVRSAICSVNADESCYLLQSTGQSNNKGIITATYNQPIAIKAQIQFLSGDDLQQVDVTLRTAITRKFYLMSEALMPAGQIRPLSRTGDFIQRADLSIWRIFNVSEDFSKSGWVLVFAALQNDVDAQVKNLFASVTS